METNNTPKTITAIIVCLLLSVALAILAGTLFDADIKNGKNAALTDAINSAAEGNAGYEDITHTYVSPGEKGTALYAVKSGTGGKGVYCVTATAKRRGCTVETLTAFSADGVIMSVTLLDVKGGVYNAKELLCESGMLAELGGVSYDSESLSIKGVPETGGCDEAVLISVNRACDTMKKVLHVEEEVSK